LLSAGEYQRRNNVSGAKTNETVDAMLQELVSNMQLNITVKKSYADGYPQMEKQFKMDYCVEFRDFHNAKWLLKVTNSIRDRIYGTEFFAQNLRIIDAGANTIENIFVVVPDSIVANPTEYANAKRYSDKIKGSAYKSYLTDVVTIGELRELIVKKCMANTSQGLRANILGKDAEDGVVQMLEDESNWHLWNDYEACKHEAKSSSYPLFRRMMVAIGAIHCTKSGISPNPIKSINATSAIPKLQSGGYPKTDVSFDVTFADGTTQTRNITIKKTEKSSVSVHEGDVADLISALGLPQESPLALALCAFQKYGSRKGIEESFEAHCVGVLDSELSKYNAAIVEFAIFGVNSPRITQEHIQIADCVLFVNNSVDKCFWLREEYVQHYLATYATRGQFGTPFQWTYPSKKRGKSFQLKGFTS